jgi:poly [ADP-ribose] polymerase 10/14/15
VQKKEFDECEGCIVVKESERKHFETIAGEKKKEHKKHAEDQARKLGKKRPPKIEELKKSGATLDDWYKIADRVQKYMQMEHGLIRVVKIEKVLNDRLEQAWYTAKADMIDPTKDPRLLFHGTSVEATAGIAKDGFRLPEKKEGNMFGQGIYLATDSTKSANPLYTSGSNRLLVCDALLGSTCAIEGWSKRFPLDQFVRKSRSGSNQGRYILDVDLDDVRRKGFDSVFAARDCSGAGGVKFDEFVVYDPKLVLPKYIVHFSNGHGSAAGGGGGAVLQASKPAVTLLRMGDFDYASTLKRFQKTCPEHTVLKIERVDNVGLRMAYTAYRDGIVAPGNNGNANEQWLFHGSDAATVKKLSTGSNQCFDRSFTTAYAYGKGVYFARDAVYSSSPRYSKPASDGTQQMFCARVAVGVPTKGNSQMTAPPERDGMSHTRYDSTVDSMSNSSVVVVYHDAAAYPEFIVTFKGKG